jgi:putative peptidoglycan lipid II flippase
MTVIPIATSSAAPRKASEFKRAAGIVVAGTLLSRVVGMVREMVIAHQFGLSGQTDAYNAAFKLPDTLMYLIAGGALASTFIPVFTEYLQKDDHKGAWKTFSIVSTITALAATFFVVIAEIFAHEFVRLLNPGFGGARLNLAVGLTRIVLPAQIFFMLGGLFMGTLNARKQFLVPALGPTIYNVGIIMGAFLRPELGIYGLMWGALIGAFIGNFALQIYKVVDLGLRFRPSLDISHPGAVKVWRLMMPIVLGVSLPNVDQIISFYFASKLPVGSTTAIGYATRLMLIPIGIFAQAMGIAILPTMSQQARDLSAFRRTAAHGLRFVLFLTVPSSVLMFLLAGPITSLLFEHGRFNAHDASLTAYALRFYSIGIFAWSAQAILTRGFYALQDTWTPVISGSIMTAVFITMNWYIIQRHASDWGVGGLAAATSIAATLHMIVMYYFLTRRTHGLQGVQTLAMLIKLAVATAALILSTLAVEKFVSTHFLGRSILTFALLVGLPALAGGIMFVLVALVLKMEESSSVIGVFDKAVSRLTGKTEK